MTTTSPQAPSVASWPRSRSGTAHAQALRCATHPRNPSPLTYPHPAFMPMYAVRMGPTSTVPYVHTTPGARHGLYWPRDLRSPLHCRVVRAEQRVGPAVVSALFRNPSCGARVAAPTTRLDYPRSRRRLMPAPTYGIRGNRRCENLHPVPLVAVTERAGASPDTVRVAADIVQPYCAAGVGAICYEKPF